MTVAVGNIPGDLVASAVLDTLTLAVEPGSIGVAVSSVVADGPSALRVTLSGPADIGGTIAIAEVDSNGGAPFVAVAEPTGTANEWRISWAPVGGGGGGITAIIANAPIGATVAGATAFLQLFPGTAGGQLLTWDAGLGQWVPQLPAPPAVPWTVNTALGVELTNPAGLAADIVGAVYVDAPRVLSASCAALFYHSTPPYRAQLVMVDGTGAAAATFDTLNTAVAVSSGAIVGGATPIAAGWYTLRLALVVGAGTLQACGLSLTE